ncbi:hypothetical protein BHE74_00005278 [Ensete ventricosum]|nr:hypothetical protein BHE74_00005278 [Ensete ventricosum]
MSRMVYPCSGASSTSTGPFPFSIGVLVVLPKTCRMLGTRLHVVFPQTRPLVGARALLNRGTSNVNSGERACHRWNCRSTTCPATGLHLFEVEYLCTTSRQTETTRKGIVRVLPWQGHMKFVLQGNIIILSNFDQPVSPLSLAQGLLVPSIFKRALSLTQGLSVLSIHKRALSLTQGLSVMSISKRALSLAQGLSVPSISKRVLSLAQGFSVPSISKQALSLAQGFSVPSISKQALSLAQGSPSELLASPKGFQF